MERRKIVLTGGICSGKTTIIQELSQRGFLIIEESAVATIKVLQQELGGIDQQKKWIQNDFATGFPSEFHTKNLVRQIQNESISDNTGDIFLDRGIFDYLAFCRLRNLPLSQWMERVFSTKIGYYKVFLCDTLPIFDNREGTGRIIDETLARKMTVLCKEAYEEMGYSLVDVPGVDSCGNILDTHQRIDFILQNI